MYMYLHDITNFGTKYLRQEIKAKFLKILNKFLILSMMILTKFLSDKHLHRLHDISRTIFVYNTIEV